MFSIQTDFILYTTSWLTAWQARGIKPKVLAGNHVNTTQGPGFLNQSYSGMGHSILCSGDA